ncbi:hypothetical protein Snas_2568 [Stackebrandtia nassauensis DSM 44728]|uniref:Uncharacterized protein n=1 Tax=Stackebrandtia nassauensis (strain DSM 44728 / CIP 108903 / NRRL B-16338 / NBRC 102104 / LLR-40K-21) TaxID=446470 RepID=D3Q673_STANL|nr:hypothetical protein [Stackebrandtia nassauensis]ADD42248.1 hypothetical protein Snas_2568 [Stackebrandtia nassauensis DSM 44728]
MSAGWRPVDEWLPELANRQVLKDPDGALDDTVPAKRPISVRVLDPLGMKDTGFHVPAGKMDRFPPLYAPDSQTGEFKVEDEAEGGHLAYGLGQHGGWGFGMAVRTFRGDYAPLGQFG